MAAAVSTWTATRTHSLSIEPCGPKEDLLRMTWAAIMKFLKIKEHTMYKTKTISLLALIVYFASLSTYAAVVEIDATIKSVDAKSRGITVTYESKGKQKIIELDVSRKAKISNNGKDGTLDSLKSGQKAKVSYEKELLIATKINATGAGTPPGKEVYRLTIHISEFGDGKLRIEKTSELPKDDFEGTPFKFPHWPKTKATKGKDGIYRLVHDFSDPDDLDVLSLLPPVNVSIKKDSGGLLFRHGGVPGKAEGKKNATFCYGKKLRLPLTIQCDIADSEFNEFSVKVINSPNYCLVCSVGADSSQSDPPLEIQTNWFDIIERGKQNRTLLFEQKGVSLQEPFDKQFRLPMPNAKIDDVMWVELVAFGKDGRTTMPRLEVRGRIVATFGMSMGQQKEKVFASNITRNSLAEKAGFMMGDVLLAINDKNPKTVVEAADMLSDLRIGEEAVFTVQRKDKTKKLRIIVE
jgi:hypothetical protein